SKGKELPKIFPTEDQGAAGGIKIEANAGATFGKDQVPAGGIKIEGNGGATFGKGDQSKPDLTGVIKQVGENVVKTAEEPATHLPASKGKELPKIFPTKDQGAAGGIKIEANAGDTFGKGDQSKPDLTGVIKQVGENVVKTAEEAATHLPASKGIELPKIFPTKDQGATGGIKIEGNAEATLGKGDQSKPDLAGVIEKYGENVVKTAEEAATHLPASKGKELPKIFPTKDQGAAGGIKIEANAGATFGKGDQSKPDLTGVNKQVGENVVKTAEEAATHLPASKGIELPKIFPTKDQVPAGGIKIEGNAGATFGKGDQSKPDLTGIIKQVGENVVKTAEEAATHLPASKGIELPKIFPTKDQGAAGGIKIEGNAGATFGKGEQSKPDSTGVIKQVGENVVKTAEEAATHLPASKGIELPKIFPTKDQVPAGGIKIEGNAGATFNKNGQSKLDLAAAKKQSFSVSGKEKEQFRKITRQEQSAIHAIEGMKEVAASRSVKCDPPECLSDDECPFNLACLRGKCSDPCNCGVGAQCHVCNHQPSCICPPGYVGDPEIACTKNEESELRDTGASWEQRSTNRVRSKTGFKGLGDFISRLFSFGKQGANKAVKDLVKKSDAAAGEEQGASNPSVKCDPPECLSDDECPFNLACLRGKCSDPCNCGVGAQCHVCNHQPSCVCPPGYVGDPEVVCVKSDTATSQEQGSATPVERQKSVDLDKQKTQGVPNPIFSSGQGTANVTRFDGKEEGKRSKTRSKGVGNFIRRVFSIENVRDEEQEAASPSVKRNAPKCLSDDECSFNLACLRGECRDPCNCGVGAQCHVCNHQPSCVCPPGYVGDPEVACTKSEVEGHGTANLVTINKDGSKGRLDSRGKVPCNG
ncbi:hypothetical protein Bhyg_16095, partial [Pseudolycoriella hygida]